MAETLTVNDLLDRTYRVARGRAGFITYIVRVTLWFDPTYARELASIAIAIVWMVCTALPGTALESLPTLRVLLAVPDPLIAGVFGALAAAQLWAIITHRPTWRSRLSLAAAILWGALGGSIIVNVPSAPGGWTYLLLGLWQLTAWLRQFIHK